MKPHYQSLLQTFSFPYNNFSHHHSPMQKKFQLHKLLHSTSQFNEQAHLCYICFDIKVDPIKCNTCKSSYCKYCADTWKKNNNSCPNRCSPVWEYQLTTPLEIKLKCPYQCETLITPNEFVTHMKNCSNRPFKVTDAELRLKYRCDSNHELEYLSSPSDVGIDSQCASCFTTQSICRSICLECKGNGERLYTYCALCRFPKGFTKTCCPVGHSDFYIKKSAKSKYTYCDVCSEKVLKNGKGCVEDKECDFAMCRVCYEKLEKGPGEPLDFEGYEDEEESIEEDDSEINQQIVDFNSLLSQLLQSMNNPQALEQLQNNHLAMNEIHSDDDEQYEMVENGEDQQDEDDEEEEGMGQLQMQLQMFEDIEESSMNQESNNQ